VLAGAGVAGVRAAVLAEGRAAVVGGRYGAIGDACATSSPAAPRMAGMRTTASSQRSRVRITCPVAWAGPGDARGPLGVLPTPAPPVPGRAGMGDLRWRQVRGCFRGGC